MHRLIQDIRCRELLCRERRSESRLPFHRPVRVTPLGEDLGAFDGAVSDTITGYTRDISPGGVGFLHDHPLATRRVLLTFDLLDGELLSLVVELTWCRYLGDFWYSSGGRLVAVAPRIGSILPAAREADPSQHICE